MPDPTQIIAGKLSPTPNRKEIRFSPQSGIETLYGIEGPKAGMIPLIEQLIAAGYAGNCVIDDASPIAKITYQVARLDDGSGGEPAPEVPIPIWEMSSNPTEIDILEADGISQAMSDEDRRKIREAINNPQEGQSPSLTDPQAIEVYLLMLKGVRSVRVNLVTLRVTRTVSTSYPILNPLLNNNYVYTSATLRLVESVPPQIYLPNDSMDSEFAYGWLKKFPGIAQTGFNKFNLTQEWEYGRWSRFVYGDPL